MCLIHFIIKNLINNQEITKSSSVLGAYAPSGGFWSPKNDIYIYTQQLQHTRYIQHPQQSRIRPSPKSPSYYTL